MLLQENTSEVYSMQIQKTCRHFIRIKRKFELQQYQHVLVRVQIFENVRTLYPLYLHTVLQVQCTHSAAKSHNLKTTYDREIYPTFIIPHTATLHATCVWYRTLPIGQLMSHDHLGRQLTNERLQRGLFLEVLVTTVADDDFRSNRGNTLRLLLHSEQRVGGALTGTPPLFVTKMSCTHST